MNFATVTSLFGGSLLTFATLAAGPADAKLGNGGTNPFGLNPSAIILSENIRTAAPETARFTPANGYTGDKTLLVVPLRQILAKPSPLNSVPVPLERAELLRFDSKLSSVPPAASILQTFAPSATEGRLQFVPTVPVPKSE